MSSITILWSTTFGACLTMMLVHLVVWTRDRRSWANHKRVLEEDSTLVESGLLTHIS